MCVLTCCGEKRWIEEGKGVLQMRESSVSRRGEAIIHSYRRSHISGFDRRGRRKEEKSDWISLPPSYWTCLACAKVV